MEIVISYSRRFKLFQMSCTRVLGGVYSEWRVVMNAISIDPLRRPIDTDGFRSAALNSV